MTEGMPLVGFYRPCFRDYLSFAKQEVCALCGKPLLAGAALFFLGLQGKRIMALGPRCAREVAFPGSMRSVPDLTLGTQFSNIPFHRSAPLARVRKGQRGTALSIVEIADAVAYATLLTNRLPKLGLLNPSVLEASAKSNLNVLCQSHQQGVPDYAALRQTLVSMEKAEFSAPALSFPNLLATYFYGCVLMEAKQQPVALRQGEINTVLELHNTLSSSLFLTKEQAAEVLRLGKSAGLILPRPTGLSFSRALTPS